MTPHTPLVRAILHVLEEGPSTVDPGAVAAHLPPSLARRLEREGPYPKELPGARWDRLTLALVALRMGGEIERVCGALSWRDFEGFAGMILASNGFHYAHGVRLRDPRAEIDLVGWNERVALAVDCKHWRALPPRRVEAAAHAQVHRTQRLRFAPLFGALRPRTALPVIVCLYAPLTDRVASVPIVSASRLDRFVREVEGYLGLYHTVPLHGPGRGLTEGK